MAARSQYSHKRSKHFLLSLYLTATSTRNNRTSLNALSIRNETAEFANSVDPDEAAHYELPNLGVHCLPSTGSL